MRSWVLILAGAVLAALSGASFADDVDGEANLSGLAVGGKVGTTGLGAEVTLDLTETLNLRGGFSSLQIGHNDEVDEIEYDFDLDFQFVFVLLDLHLFESGFRLSAGAVINDSAMTLTGVLSGPEEIGGNVYPADAVGSLTAALTFDDLAPYVGVGYGNAVGDSDRWTFSFDLGVIFQQYEVDLTATGPVSGDPGFIADLALEERDIQDEVDTIKIYPVLAFGVACQL